MSAPEYLWIPRSVPRKRTAEDIQHLLTIDFLAAVVISGILWSGFVLGTSIDIIPNRFLPLIYLLPWEYWMGSGLLIIATLIWYFSPRTQLVHFLLGPYWLLYLIIGPELVQVTPRGSDLLGHLIGLTYYDNDLYKFPFVGYSAFPSFHFLLLQLRDITGLEFLEVGKFAGPMFHILRQIAVMLFSYGLYESQKRHCS